jgi:hypothetical protein
VFSPLLWRISTEAIGSTTPVSPVRAVVPAGSPAPGGALGALATRRAGSSGTFVRGLDTNILRLAVQAAHCATTQGLAPMPSTLTVIDYSKPSTEKRLWVFDVASGHVLYHELVAHGSGTGDNLATSFSNVPDSHQSSLGLFLTQDTYVGKNGYSLRLRGLEPGTNDRAWERAIVFHGAPYVSDRTVSAMGRLGRSWGCPALNDAIARHVIDDIKGGGLVFSYFPDQDWLANSPFLGQCQQG